MSIGEAINISATGFIVVLIILAILACIIVVLSKAIRTFEEKGTNTSKENSKKETNVLQTPVPAVKTEVPSQNINTSGGLELYKTSEKTAAAIMAIVSHESGIPLNRLDFRSIRLDDSLDLYKTDDKTAATVMAIVSHQTGIPLDRLLFKSIKLIEK